MLAGICACFFFARKVACHNCPSTRMILATPVQFLAYFATHCGRSVEPLKNPNRDPAGPVSPSVCQLSSSVCQLSSARCTLLFGLETEKGQASKERNTAYANRTNAQWLIGL